MGVSANSNFFMVKFARYALWEVDIIDMECLCKVNGCT